MNISVYTNKKYISAVFTVSAIIELAAILLTPMFACTICASYIFSIRSNLEENVNLYLGLSYSPIACIYQFSLNVRSQVLKLWENI